MSSKLKRYLSQLYLAVCWLGLLWHCYSIGDPYFKYKVITTISIDWTKEEFPKSLNVGLFNMRFDYKTPISRLWGMTPSVEDVAPTKYDPMCGHINDTHILRCSDLIIEKYIYKSRPYYSYSPPSDKKGQTTNIVNREHFIFHKGSTTFYLTLKTYNTTYPFVAIGAFLSDLRESPLAILQRQMNYLPYVENTAYTFEYSHLNVIKLEAPFTDHCTDYTSLPPYLACQSRATCLTKCVDNATRYHFNQVAVVSLITQSSNLTYFDPSADFNQDKISKYDKLISDCKTTFQNPDCEINTILSNAKHVTIYFGFKDMIGFGAELSGNPSTIIKSDELIPFIDFITFILGSLGTWLGFSFSGTVPSFFEFFEDENNQITDLNQDNNQDEDLNKKLIDEISECKSQIFYLTSKCDSLQEQLTATNVKLDRIQKRRAC